MKISTQSTPPPPPAKGGYKKAIKFAELRKQFRELASGLWLFVETEDLKERRAVQQAIRREARALGIEVYIQTKDLKIWATKKDAS